MKKENLNKIRIFYEIFFFGQELDGKTSIKKDFK